MKSAKCVLLAAVLLAWSQTPSLRAQGAREDSFDIEPRVAGGVTYLTGGIGRDHRTALGARGKDYNLKLVFALTDHHAFVAGVAIRILGETGRQVFALDDVGPWFFTRLPAGTYRISATLDGRTLERMARVQEGRQVELPFYW